VCVRWFGWKRSGGWWLGRRGRGGEGQRRGSGGRGDVLPGADDEKTGGDIWGRAAGSGRLAEATEEWFLTLRPL
jgi:hypothetical protein